jgi:hypothetical protein
MSLQPKIYIQQKSYSEVLKDIEKKLDEYSEILKMEQNNTQENSEKKEFTEKEWQDFAKEMYLNGGTCDIGETDDIDDFFNRLRRL